MKKYLNICNIYILLWCIYYLQGIVYASGSIISQMILLLLMLISGYYFIEVNISYRIPSFLKVLNVFIGVMTIYGIFLILDPTPIYYSFTLSEQAGKIDFLKSLYISLLPIYSMYAFTKQGILKIESIQALTLVLIISTTLSYFRAEQEAIRKAIEIGSTREEFTNNTGYDFLSILPLVFFWNKKPILQYALLAFIFTFIVMGMKRGAIMIGLVCLIWFIYRTYKSSKSNRSLIIFITSIAIICGVTYIIDFYNNSEYFQYRIEQTLEGNSSGRDDIYGSLWQYYINQDSLMHILFGNGAIQTVKIAGNYAHNDWLELLICQGLLGAVIYLAYFMSLYKSFKNSRNNALLYNILGMCLFIMFASSLFSMSYNSLSLSITLCLGYCCAKQTS